VRVWRYPGSRGKRHSRHSAVPHLGNVHCAALLRWTQKAVVGDRQKGVDTGNSKEIGVAISRGPTMSFVTGIFAQLAPL
jgi:hypothetical protein